MVGEAGTESGGKSDACPGFSCLSFPHARVLACQGVYSSRVMGAEACRKANKSPSFLLTVAAGRPGPTPLRPRHSHAPARVLEAGLNQVPGYSPAGNETTVRGHFLMAPAQRRVLSEQRCRRPAGAAIGRVHVFPGS